VDPATERGTGESPSREPDLTGQAAGQQHPPIGLEGIDRGMHLCEQAEIDLVEQRQPLAVMTVS
jgi:hypothetical protein